MEGTSLDLVLRKIALRSAINISANTYIQLHTGRRRLHIKASKLIIYIHICVCDCPLIVGSDANESSGPFINTLFWGVESTGLVLMQSDRCRPSIESTKLFIIPPVRDIFPMVFQDPFASLSVSRMEFRLSVN